MVGGDTLHIAGGVHQAIWRVCGDGHDAPKVAHKEAKWAFLAWVTFGFESCLHHLDIDFYILGEVGDLFWHV